MLQTRREVRTAISLLLVFVLAATLGCNRAQTQPPPGYKPSTASKASNASWNFDDVPVGKLAAVWKVDATNRKGPLATWQVIKDTTAPSSDHVLAMTSPNHTFGGTFNICWTDTVSFLDGEIEVHFKAVKGEEDPGRRQGRAAFRKMAHPQDRSARQPL